ncbi:MAG: hypothetical protein ABI222_07850, partial [Opitutaceae bacterium]
MTAIVLFSAIMAFCMGAAVLWANPERFANQVFAIAALLVAIHAVLILCALRDATLLAEGQLADPLPMVRGSSAVLMFIPWLIWMQKESMVTDEAHKKQSIMQSMPLFIISFILAALCFTDWYIPSDSTPSNEKRGLGYMVTSIIMIGICGMLIVRSWGEMRRQKGIRRIETQFLVLNCAIGAISALGLALLGHLIDVPVIRRFGHLIIIVVYALSAWAITYYRIFDVRQVFLSLAHRAGIVTIIALGSYVAWSLMGARLPQSMALLMSVAIFTSLAFWMDRQTRIWLGLGGERELDLIRREIIGFARTEPHPEKLVARYESLLRDRFCASFASIFVDQGAMFTANGVEFVKVRPACAALVDSGWVTPESLLRRRSSPGLLDLREFVFRHAIGLMIAVPRASSSPVFLLTLGTKGNKWPFTYPEVERLQSIAELMDSILTRSRLTMQAAMQAKMEHLAMMSRGLAHDLKNLITPVSSFLVHTDSQ